ncbi:MAG: cytochrome c [Deltaproteobacteria bacterium]|nr:MAG: cytochrome c [Deltaproteobacteria bacterium]
MGWIERTVLVIAVAAACETSQPRFTEPMVLGGVTVDAATLERGQRVFMLRCATCHGARGDGKGPSARTLARPPADLTRGVYPATVGGEDRLPTDDELRTRILRGLPERGMPPFTYLDPGDLDAVVQFLKTLAPAWHGQGPT